MTTRIVAVDGPGGAGKSTIAERLAAALGGAPIVHTDDFAGWEEPLEWWPRLLRELLEPLARNEPARFQPTSWGGPPKPPVEVAPVELLVLEGVSASRAAFRPYLTSSIWVETPRNVRLARGLARDGQAARLQWEKWMAEEDAYIERERPQEHADLVLRGDAAAQDA